MLLICRKFQLMSGGLLSFDGVSSDKSLCRHIVNGNSWQPTNQPGFNICSDLMVNMANMCKYGSLLLCRNVIIGNWLLVRNFQKQNIKLFLRDNNCVCQVYQNNNDSKWVTGATKKILFGFQWLNWLCEHKQLLLLETSNIQGYMF